ncbi:MAG: biotin/lipoyl-binding protein [Melioribacteraceae bacterium]|nr:biotin/lipoyl-binding protein [Melioribacteraceae bacterium]MCF8263871.1 biotin/lipoyl-binding protein [Melioribacteraceae bacterium]MCF8412403.1 biotin/lipoyl-binding protein [Melioribacteraceae bacterium]
MKKFKFMIRGNNYDVEILTIEDDIAEIEVNGSKYKVEIQHEKKQSKTPKLVRPHFTPNIEKEESAKKGNGAGAVKSPLPGTILELKVKVGDKVKVDDTLLIMEAMKMENNIKSDRDGIVTEIKINVGDSVLEGDILVELGS